MEKQRAKFLDLLDGYEIPSEHRNEKGEPIVGKSFFSRSFTGTLSGKTSLSSNRLFDAFRILTKRFLNTSVRVYGTMLLIFGSIAALISLASDYFVFGSDSTAALITGLVLAVLGIVLTFAESPIGKFAENFFLTDYLFFEFFCIKRMQKNTDVRPFTPSFGIVAGVLLGALSVPFHPLRVVLALFLLLFIALSFASPEFSFLLTLLLLPYTGILANTTYVLAALLIITALSFLRKVISGKRVYVFEKYDFLIGIMIVFVLISGIFIKGMESFESSVMILLGALGYILASNLVTNRRLADRVSAAITFSSLPASVYAVISYIITAAKGNYEYSGEGFFSTSVFGAFITVAILFTISLLKEAKRSAEEAVYISILFVQFAALVCTASFMAAAALIFSLICFIALKIKRLSGIFVLIVILLGYAILLLPEQILNSEAAMLIIGRSADELRELWGASFEMFSKNPLIGVGMGSESFSEEIVKYSENAHTNAANIFLELACEAGIFALIFFVLVLLESLRHRSRYRSYVRISQVKTVSNTAMLALIALIIYGSVNYIWESSATCYLFWCVFGLGSATLRISKREHDDRIIYYNDVVSPESSDIDVQIDGFDSYI